MHSYILLKSVPIHTKHTHAKRAHNTKRMDTFCKWSKSVKFKIEIAFLKLIIFPRIFERKSQTFGHTRTSYSRGKKVQKDQKHFFHSDLTNESDTTSYLQ